MHCALLPLPFPGDSVLVVASGAAGLVGIGPSDFTGELGAEDALAVPACLPIGLFVLGFALRFGVHGMCLRCGSWHISHHSRRLIQIDLNDVEEARCLRWADVHHGNLVPLCLRPQVSRQRLSSAWSLLEAFLPFRAICELRFSRPGASGR